MSKFRIGIAVLVGAAALSSAAPATAGLRISLGGGPLGVVRALAHVLPHGGYHRRHGGRVRWAAARDTTEALPRTDVSRNGDQLSKPTARVMVAAAAALAGWHGGRVASGWWRHGDGGYGWVGPLFWPFAYDDIYDYTLWGDGIGFWGYGYGDIYAAIFAPYGHDDLARYMASSRGRRHGRAVSLAQMCGDDRSEVAGVPVDQIRQAIQPNDEQRTALDDLANASIQAAQAIRAACPAQTASTASGRLAAMQQRVDAMISAVARIRPPFEKFYELLDDEQKARLNKLAEDRRTDPASKIPPAQSCSDPQSTTFQWPASEIEARLQLDEMQHSELDVLQHMSAKARDILNYDCQPDEGLAPPDRLATVDTRLDAMLEAIKLVRPALEDFYATLNDEQKAQFEAIGPRRTS